MFARSSRSLATRAIGSALRKSVTKVALSRQYSNLARPSVMRNVAAPLQRPSMAQRQYATDKGGEVVVVPSLGDSISEGQVLKLLKKVGDTVKTDEAVLSLETEKTSMEINAPYNGVIAEIFVKESDSVNPGKGLFRIEKRAGAAPASAPSPSPSPSSSPSAPPPKQQASAPSAPSTPPPAPTPSPSPAPSSSKPTGSVAPSSSRGETREKMTLMRKKTAERLKSSQNTAAMLTTTQECDTSAIAELRTTFGEDFLKKHGTKLGFMSVFIKASVAALQDQPIINASIVGDEIVYKNYNDISVAVATPRGLMVPVLRDCEKKSMAEIEKELAALGARARKDQIAIEEMVGGTFTVSNGGVYGSLMGMPIINPPQSAILGMHGIFKRPVAIGDRVEIRPMMYIALTYDHRLIDGREAVTFLKKIKDAVEDPRRLLLEL